MRISNSILRKASLSEVSLYIDNDQVREASTSDLQGFINDLMELMIQEGYSRPQDIKTLALKRNLQVM